MALDRYKVFVKVAETKNITKTAEALNYSQSAVSHIIKNMEKELDLKLMLRDKNGIRLTSAGCRLLSEAKNIIRHEQAFLHTAALLSGTQLGTISVGSFSSTSIKWMPGIIKGMQKQYPNIEINLSHSPYHVIEQHLKEGIIDCGFISSRHMEKCDFFPLLDDEYFVVLPDGHYLQKYEAIPLEALLEEKIILMKDGTTYGTAYYDTANILEPIRPRIVQTVEDDFVALAMVEAGLGITILPKLILDCITTPLILKHFAIPRYRTLGIAVKSIQDATPLTRLFISYVQEYAAQYQNSN